MNNLMQYMSTDESTRKVDKNLMQLHIRNKLPQIVVPIDKISMFLDWYNADLRFTDDIPRSFNEGYMFVENDFLKLDYNSIEIREAIKEAARDAKTTYRVMESFLQRNQKDLENLVVYFRFNDNLLNLYMYGQNSSKLLTTLVVGLDKIKEDEPNPPIERYMSGDNITSPDVFPKLYMYYCFILLQCALWYLATTTKTTKYYYEERRPVTHHKEKRTVNPRSVKTVSTPIYDFKKIRKVKVEGLVKRRKGWTYSHAFTVHGHYRHYKDGKVVFVKSYIKGKGKEQIGQKIVLNPKE